MLTIHAQFLLDPNIHFLNHGSFGATPKPVLETFRRWQDEMERQPVEFLGRRFPALMAEARAALAAYVGADADEVVYFPNPTTAINMLARSLHFEPGDEILTTDHEYGACDRTWRYVARQRGWKYVAQPIPLPVRTAAEFVEQFWAGVTERTRAIFISHITSPTALIFPVAEICQRARERGILTIIDGAHAPGQIPLDLHALGVDYYTGALHKWLCAPKGAAFFYARREMQKPLDPLVVSWGYESETPTQSQFVDYHEWQGTRELSAFLSVPAAIEFQRTHNWDTVRQACHQLARDTRSRLERVTHLESLCPDDAGWYLQLFAVRLPQNTDLALFKTRLYEEFRIEAPTILWNGQKFLRVSFQGYNTQEDADALVNALKALISA
jgi:isopenicillin-N epimerase